MISLFLIYQLFIPNRLENIDLEGTYYGQTQICNYSKTIYLYWELNIKSENNFEYTQLTEDGSEKFTNKIIGRWSIKNDSLLVLTNIVKYQNDTCPTDSIIYKIKKNRLYTTFNCFDFSPETSGYLEYLDKYGLYIQSNFINPIKSH